MVELAEVAQLLGEGQAEVWLVAPKPLDLALVHGVLGDAPWSPDAMRREGLNESSYLFVGLWSGDVLERWIWLATAPEAPADLVAVEDGPPQRQPESMWVHRQGDELPWNIAPGQWRLTIAANIPDLTLEATAPVLPPDVALDAHGVARRVWWEPAHDSNGAEENWEWQWQVHVEHRAIALGDFFVWGPATSAGQRDLTRIIPYFERDGEVREEPFPSPGSTFAGGGRGHFFGTGPIFLDAGAWTGHAGYAQTSTAPPNDVMAGIGSLLVTLEDDPDGRS